MDEMTEPLVRLKPLVVEKSRRSSFRNTVVRRMTATEMALRVSY